MSFWKNLQYYNPSLEKNIIIHEKLVEDCYVLGIILDCQKNF